MAEFVFDYESEPEFDFAPPPEASYDADEVIDSYFTREFNGIIRESYKIEELLTLNRIVEGKELSESKEVVRYIGPIMPWLLRYGTGLE